MRSSMSWEDLWPLLLDGTLDTLYMVGLAALFTVLIGLPPVCCYLFPAPTGWRRCRN